MRHAKVPSAAARQRGGGSRSATLVRRASSATPSGAHGGGHGPRGEELTFKAGAPHCFCLTTNVACFGECWLCGTAAFCVHGQRLSQASMLAGPEALAWNHAIVTFLQLGPN